MHLDAVADLDAVERAARDGVVERRIVVDIYDLPGHGDRPGGRIHGLHRALQQPVLLDELRSRAALVVNLRLDAHHLADAQLGHRAGAILDAHLGARRVVADAVDDDAAETADGPGDDHRLGGAWSGRRLRCRRNRPGRRVASASAAARGDEQRHRCREEQFVMDGFHVIPLNANHWKARVLIGSDARCARFTPELRSVIELGPFGQDGVAGQRATRLYFAAGSGCEEGGGRDRPTLFVSEFGS